MHTIERNFFKLFKGNFPRPVIRDYGEKFECISLYVKNSNNLSWLPDQKSVLEGVHYTLRETHDYLSDGYRRLELRIIDKDLAGKFGEKAFDVVENMQYYYIAFPCIATFWNEPISRDYNITFTEKGKFLMNVIFHTI